MFLHSIEQIVTRGWEPRIFQLTIMRIHLVVDGGEVLVFGMNFISEVISNIHFPPPHRSYTFSLNSPHLLRLTHINPAITIRIVKQASVKVSPGYSQSCAHLFIRDTRYPSGRCFRRFRRIRVGTGLVERFAERTTGGRGDKRILSTGPLAPSPPS